MSGMRLRNSKIRRLEELVPHIREGRYRIGSHVAKHMLQEGFIETDVLRAVEWGKERAIYVEDSRMLVSGEMVFPPSFRLPLHVILEFSDARWVDIVTAFIPKKPHQIYSRGRVAALLKYEKDFEEVRWVRPKFALEQ